MSLGSNPSTWGGQKWAAPGPQDPIGGGGGVGWGVTRFPGSNPGVWGREGSPGPQSPVWPTDCLCVTHLGCGAKRLRLPVVEGIVPSTESKYYHFLKYQDVHCSISMKLLTKEGEEERQDGTVFKRKEEGQQTCNIC